MKRNYWYIGISEWLKNKLLGTETIVVRARNKAGQYLKDDPKTKKNEAYTKKVVKKKATKKKATKKKTAKK
jgi:hypothetical protein|tara:strand:- start:216 stop:428 length:213 start_codon:yes stop_codon:yes gene_type:complete